MAYINSQSCFTLNHMPRDKLFLNTPPLSSFLPPPLKFIPYTIHRQTLIHLLPHTSSSSSSSSVSIKPMATCLDTSRREAKQNPDRRVACCRQGVWQSASSGRPPLCQAPQNPTDPHLPPNGSGGRYPTGYIWQEMLLEAETDIKREPILSSYYAGSITSLKSLETALANHLATKLDSSSLPSSTLSDLFLTVLREDGGEIIQAVEADLRAVRERDPACISYVHCFLNFKGFLACQAHRIAHKLWVQRRKTVALLIQNRVSEVFAVDIHPGAVIGRGLLLDHATGVVIGETAVIGENVSILHNVTLGGTGKAHGDRHPKIGDGVLIGAGTCVLGNVRVGDGAKIGAGSLVLKDVPARTTAVGNPARLIGGKENPIKLDKIPSFTMDHTSHIQEWSDYVI